MKLLELEKLSHSQAALTSAYRASLPMQERGWVRYPVPSWENPAIVAMQDSSCVGGLNYSQDADDNTLSVRFAWAEPSHPMVFSALLVRFRAKFKGSRYTDIYFTCHDGNEQMAKAVQAMRLQPFSRTYKIALNTMGEG